MKKDDQEDKEAEAKVAQEQEEKINAAKSFFASFSSPSPVAPGSITTTSETKPETSTFSFFQRIATALGTSGATTIQPPSQESTVVQPHHTLLSSASSTSSQSQD